MASENFHNYTTDNVLWQSTPRLTESSIHCGYFGTKFDHHPALMMVKYVQKIGLLPVKLLSVTLAGFVSPGRRSELQNTSFCANCELSLLPARRRLQAQGPVTSGLSPFRVRPMLGARHFCKRPAPTWRETFQAVLHITLPILS